MSIKSISSAFHLSRNTVRKYVRRYQESGLTLDQLMTMSEEKLQEMFLDNQNRSRKPSPRMDELEALIPDCVKRLSSLKVAKAKNTIETELKKIERCQLLILDDAFLVPLDAKERPILLEIIEDRHDRKSIVMVSQLPVENWYDAIGDQAVADAVLDRIVHSSHRIELFGESIRKMKAKK